MGLRVRKSIKLGGGARINLSKTGLGFSWGIPGFRITKTARKTTRKTYGIPGTGISFVEESGKRKTRNAGPAISQSQPANIFATGLALTIIVGVCILITCVTREKTDDIESKQNVGDSSISAAAVARKEFAKNARQRYFAGGRMMQDSIKLSTKGSDEDVLEMEWVMAGEYVYRNAIIRSGILEEAKQMGFTTAVLRKGNTLEFSWNLEDQDHWPLFDPSR
jgi:hypothetical protein